MQRPYRLAYERLQGELLALTDPAAHGLAVHGVRDAKEIGDTEVRIRGQAEKLGPKVPRGFLTAFEVPEAPSVNAKQSGRLELAALAHQFPQPAHPESDRQPRLVPPVRAGDRFDRRQLRHDGRPAIESRIARPPRDSLHPRRMVDQAAGASDRLEPGVSAWLEGHTEASRRRSGKCARLAAQPASARRGGAARRDARRLRQPESPKAQGLTNSAT